MLVRQLMYPQTESRTDCIQKERMRKLVWILREGDFQMHIYIQHTQTGRPSHSRDETDVNYEVPANPWNPRMLLLWRAHRRFDCIR